MDGRSSWAKIPSLPALPPPPDRAAPCSYAEEFAVSCQGVLELLRQHAPRHSGEGDVTLRWIKAALLDCYTDFRTETPSGHTNSAGEVHHHCIEDVLTEAVKAIRRFQRSLPPAPPPPPVVIPPALLPQQVSGLFYEE